MATFRDRVAADLATVFPEIGEPATYARGSFSVGVTVIFREFGGDDSIAPEVFGEASICEIIETEIDGPPFWRKPARQDRITQTLPPAGDGSEPRIVDWEVVSFIRQVGGKLVLTVQSKIRVTPK